MSNSGELCMSDGTIEGVIFDFGNVICSFDVRLFIRGLALSAGKSESEVWAFMPEISPLAVAYETGIITSDQFFRELCRVTGVTVTRESFVSAYTGIFTPIDDSFALVRSLKGRCKLGLLSNTNEWHFRHCISTLDIFPLFDAVSLSFEAKAMKPAPAIYADMLRKIALPAERCVFIDDVEANVTAAVRLGIRGIHFTGSRGLRGTLQRLGIAGTERNSTGEP
jgi:putative hydrolase of the HAD superfamily